MVLQQLQPEERSHTLSSVEEHGWTMTHIAARNGSVPMLEVLGRFGALHSQPTQNTLGAHPIHLACSGGHIGAVKYLVSAGADINARDFNGYTPLMYAGLEGNFDMIDQLILLNCDINAQDNQGRNIAMIACAAGNIRLLSRCAAIGVNLHQVDANGLSGLMIACSAGHTFVVAYLVKHGVLIEETDQKKYTALHFACFAETPSCLSLLLLMGANPNALTSNLETPLHIACKMNKLYNVEHLLVHSSVNTALKDSQGRTALSYLSSIDQLARHSCNTSNAIKILRISGRTSEMCKPKYWKMLMFGIGGGAPVMTTVVLGFISIFLLFFVVLLDTVFVTKFSALVAVVVLLELGMWTFFYLSVTSNPGVVDKHDKHLREQYFEQVEKAAMSETNDTDQMATKCCVTCHIQRPARSKHCRVCDVCVHHMDHHCVFIGNCVGRDNWKWFYLYVAFTTFLMVAFVLLCCLYCVSAGLSPALVIFSVILTPIAVSTGYLLCYQTWLAGHGLLANEHYNWHRYSHMVDEQRRFFNPFDRGFVRNIYDRLVWGQPNAQTADLADDAQPLV